MMYEERKAIICSIERDIRYYKYDIEEGLVDLETKEYYLSELIPKLELELEQLK